jgi:hypothetical protein
MRLFVKSLVQGAVRMLILCFLIGSILLTVRLLGTSHYEGLMAAFTQPVEAVPLWELLMVLLIVLFVLK